MKTIIFKVVVLTFFISINIPLKAFEINVEIVGKGQVESLDKTCKESCQISNNESQVSLKPVADSGWFFSGWEGQQCDKGSKAILQSKITDIQFIGGAIGGAKTLETIDFNNDGLDDLIGINLFEGEIIRYENLGDGTFSQKRIIANLLYPSALDSFDWNNDGYMDLFIAEYGIGTIKMYLNSGSGGFTYGKSFKFENSRPYAFSVVDYDGDDLPDFVVSSFSADIREDLFVLAKSITKEKISWFKNTGSELVEQPIIANKAAITLDTFQASSDSAPLILTAEIIAGEIVVYSNKDGIQRSVITTGGASYGAAFGDIDRNGYPDILAAHYKPAALSLTYGLVNGRFSDAVILHESTEGLTATAFGDFNNDSFIDVATGEFNKKKYYYFATTSFEECIINKSTNLNISAVFKERAEPVNDNDESGGSVYWLLYCLIGIALLPRTTNSDST